MDTSGLRWEVKFIIESQRFKGAQHLYPEVLPAEESVAYLLFGHRALFFNLFDHDDAEISVEGVASTAEMLVYLYGIITFRIVPMFIDSSIALLGFQFPYILFAISTFVAPGDVNGVFGAAVGTLSDVESLLAGSVVEHVRIDDMGTAFGVASASTRGTSSSCRLCSDDLAICESRLSE